MKDYVNEHFRAHPDKCVRPPIMLKGGRSLSVQASESHYCEPRETNYCRYYSVEVMAFTGSKTRKSCIPGWEQWENGNIYSYIPVDVVNAYIEKIGLRD
jgi:hypothetical protein